MPANLVKTPRDETLWRHAKVMALRARDVASAAVKKMDSKAQDAKLTSEDAWGMVTSFFKKLQAGKMKMQTAEQIDMVMSGVSPDTVIECAYGGSIRRLRPPPTASPCSAITERLNNPVVRAFFDGDAYVFADTEDVEVLPESHETLSAVSEMLSYLLSLEDDPHIFVVPDMIVADGFEGTISDLYEIVYQEYDRCVREVSSDKADAADL